MRQLFGTDGVRGKAGEYPLDRPTMFAVGLALARWIGSHHLNPEVVIGRDTRESGPWIAEHVAGGLAKGGAKARNAGLITTPGLAHAARTGNFAAGVMISASHNPYQDNGVKIFDHSGFKLPDAREEELEDYIFEWAATGASPEPVPVPEDPGLDAAYLDYLASTLPEGLDGLRIAIDPGNGAATHLAPALFRRLGASVECIHNAPDGRNINLHCGSQHLDDLKAKVRTSGANVGVAFDGDADRAMFVSGSGKTVNGDAMLLICGSWMARHKGLKEVVATVMSNLGLEVALNRCGIQMVRTPVGDKYVLEEMIKRDAMLGGEQSGHVIFREYATTGDGLLTALRVFEVMRDTGLDLDSLVAQMKVLPQRLDNIRFKTKRPLEDLPAVVEQIRLAKAELGDAYVVVRFSGTEPVARVMAQGESQERVDHFVTAISRAIQDELGAA